MASTSRYTIISADCHAGGNHAQYREYLESRYHDTFDAWADATQRYQADLLKCHIESLRRGGSRPAAHDGRRT